MWHSARASTGSDRSRLQPPSAVRVASRAWMTPVVVEADSPLGVEAVPLAGHGEVLGAVEAQPHRAAGQGGAQGGDGGEAVRLHLLAAEAATHPQALHGHLVAVLPSTWATISWVSEGCWVLHCTKTWPPSSTCARAQWVSR